MFASQSSQVRHTPTRHRACQHRPVRWARLPCGPSTTPISPFPRLIITVPLLLPGFAGWLAATEPRSVRPILKPISRACPATP